MDRTAVGFDVTQTNFIQQDRPNEVIIERGGEIIERIPFTGDIRDIFVNDRAQLELEFDSDNE